MDEIQVRDFHGLARVFMSPRGTDMSLYMVVPNNIPHASYGRCPYVLRSGIG